jgi:hypothetical protein
MDYFKLTIMLKAKYEALENLKAHVPENQEQLLNIIQAKQEVIEEIWKVLNDENKDC